MNTNRRNFLKTGATAALGLSGLTVISSSVLGKSMGYVAPSDKVNLACIGIGNRGAEIIRELHKTGLCNIVALCDVDMGAKQTIDIINMFPQAKKFQDFRKMFDEIGKEFDAVSVATPDFSHFPCTMLALAEGKHVYVEKPIANTIEECQIMVKAQERYGKIVQVGQWQRSGSQYDQAIQYVKSGKLGQIRLVKCWAYQGWMKPVPVVPNSPVPAGVDYDMWLGPAPKREFNANRFHFNFRWFWDYAGGLMTDWGVHEIDIALYAMGVSAPKSVMASGGKFAYPDDASETPDTLQTVYEYEGFNMLWEHATGIDGGNYGTTEGIAFIGNNATLVVNRGGWKVIPETQTVDGKKQNKTEEVAHTRPNGNALDLHAVNFVEAMTANDPKLLNCAIQTGSVAAINAQMGNIAYKTGKKVYWDSEKNLFTDSEANQLIKANNHNGWKLPKV